MNEKPGAWATASKLNLVAAFPAHVPMGLPLPDEPAPPPCPWPAPTTSPLGGAS